MDRTGTSDSHHHHHHHHHHHSHSRSEGEEGEDRETEGLEEVDEMAMVALGLLKQEVKVMLHQVKHLVKANPSLAEQVFTTNVDGWTPVHACALRGKKKVLKAMMQSGIPVNCRMGQPEGLPARCTLLHIAANRPDKKVADYLLHHGADVNAQDSFGRTPLFYAARSGNRELLKLLVDRGACPCPKVEVTSAPGEAERDRRRANEDLVTPEPKLSRFCFLPLPLHHHPQSGRQRRRHHRHGGGHHHHHHQSQSPPRGIEGGHQNGHRTS